MLPGSEIIAYKVNLFPIWLIELSHDLGKKALIKPIS